MTHTPNNQEDLVSLLSSVKTIALVGASKKTERPSYEVMEFLQSRGYKITPINPGFPGDLLLGEEVVARLSDLSSKVDMVEIFRNSAAAGAICDEVLALPQNMRPELVWMQIGVVNEPAAEKLEKEGIKVIMDQCPKRLLQT